MYHVPSSLTFPEHFIRNVGYLIKNPHAANRQTKLNHKKLRHGTARQPPSHTVLTSLPFTFKMHFFLLAPIQGPLNELIILLTDSA